VYPILLRIGNFSISTYGVLVALAALTAGWVAARGFRERGVDPDEAWRLLGFGLAGGFVGARLYYVMLHGDPSALFARAGFVWYGGLIGGTVAVLFAARTHHLPLGPLPDAFAPALALGHAIGRVGCFFSGDSYGLPSTLPWAVAFARGAPPSTAGALRQQFGVSLPANIPDDQLIAVHPTMLYSALALVAIFALLWSQRRRRMPAGALFGVYLVAAGLERFLVEFLRAKDDRLLWGFTTAQAIAAVSIIVGVVWLVVVRRKPRARAPVPVRRSGLAAPGARGDP